MSLTVRPTLRDAAQRALEALYLIRDGATGLYGDDLTRCNLALEMLSAALAEDDPETTPQPVAYISGYNKGRCIIEAVDRAYLLPVGMALYRSPLKREPLTDEEIQSLADEFLDWNLAGIESFARAVERAHRIGGKE